MTTDQNPIDQIEARLDGGKKWWQGSTSDGDWQRDPAVRVCLRGAIWATCGMFTEESNAADRAVDVVLREQFPDRVTDSTRDVVIAQFNDHPDTVFSDIEDVVLPKARQLYEDRLISQEGS